MTNPLTAAMIATIVGALDEVGDTFRAKRRAAAPAEEQLALPCAETPPSPREVRARRPAMALLPRDGATSGLVYDAVIGADEPLALREIALATGLSKPSLYRAVRRLLDDGRLFRGGPESSQHARYAVTKAAADAAAAQAAAKR